MATADRPAETQLTDRAASWLLGFAASIKLRGYPRNWSLARCGKFREAAKTAAGIFRGGAFNPLSIVDMRMLVEELEQECLRKGGAL